MAQEIGLTAKLKPELDTQSTDRQIGRLEERLGGAMQRASEQFSPGGLAQRGAGMFLPQSIARRFGALDSVLGRGGVTSRAEAPGIGPRQQDLPSRSTQGILLAQLEKLEDIERAIEKSGFSDSQGGGGGVLGTLGGLYASSRVAGSASGLLSGIPLGALGAAGAGLAAVGSVHWANSQFGSMTNRQIGNSSFANLPGGKYLGMGASIGLGSMRGIANGLGLGEVHQKATEKFEEFWAAPIDTYKQQLRELPSLEDVLDPDQVDDLTGMLDPKKIGTLGSLLKPNEVDTLSTMLDPQAVDPIADLLELNNLPSLAEIFGLNFGGGGKGDVASGAVRNFERLTNTDIPGEGSLINQALKGKPLEVDLSTDIALDPGAIEADLRRAVEDAMRGVRIESMIEDIVLEVVGRRFS